jgi:hypothetical protein
VPEPEPTASPPERNAHHGARSLSGREYPHARPKGRAPWRPQRASRELLAKVQEVLDTYADQLPLTQRQVYYRLLGTTVLPKGPTAEGRLKNVLNRGRRSGMIPWEALREERTDERDAWGWTSVAAWWDDTADAAEGFALRADTGQAEAVEVWCETAGMAPQLARVAGDYGANVIGLAGDPPVGWRYDAAERIAGRDRPTRVLLIGDLDSSGLSILDSTWADVEAFLERWPDARATPVVVAVTAEQVERLELPTAPGNPEDDKGGVMAATVQAEAIAPDQLAAILRDALEACTDAAVRQRVAERSAVLAAELAAAVHVARSRATVREAPEADEGEP